MHCLHCKEPASIHITEMIHGSLREHHLCEMHAREHLLADPIGPPAPSEITLPSGSG